MIADFKPKETFESKEKPLMTTVFNEVIEVNLEALASVTLRNKKGVTFDAGKNYTDIIKFLMQIRNKETLTAADCIDFLRNTFLLGSALLQKIAADHVDEKGEKE